MKYHIFFHSDLDGFASAGVAYSALRERGVYPEYIHRYKINYGQKFDDSKIDYDKDHIIMLDFCLQPYRKMKNLIKKSNFFTWIDHHKTSLDFVKENKNIFSKDRTVVGISLDHLIDTSKAACELTWWYFFNEEPPKLVKLIGQYDTWKKEGPYAWESEVIPLQLYLDSNRDLYNPESLQSCEWWDAHFAPILYPQDTDRKNLHDMWVHNLINKGVPLLDFQTNLYKQIAEDGAFPATFLGKYKALCINSPIQNSRVLESSYDVSEYDIMVVYSYKNLKWTFSLYTVQDNVPCGDLAKQCGEEGPYKSGGGHQKAAGFQTTIEFLSLYIKPLGGENVLVETKT